MSASALALAQRTLAAMALVDVEFLLCVRKQPVPLVKTLIDVEDGVGGLWSLLDITSRGSDLAWLEQNLGLKSRQFRTLDWPLLAEIRAALAGRRNPEDRKRRRAVRPNMLVKVLVRDREILVKNTLSVVVLAVGPRRLRSPPSPPSPGSSPI